MAQTVEDRIQAEITRDAALAMGQWLQDAGLLEKKIRFLNIAELESMAVACISAYVATRERLSAEPPSSDEKALSFTA